MGKPTLLVFDINNEEKTKVKVIKVKEGNDQEMAQSEGNSHSKN